MSESPEIVNDEAAGRLEARVGGHVAHLEYERRDGRFVALHTVVPDELEGKGVGSALARAVVDEAAAADDTLVPRCSFVRGWLERHPDTAERVAIEWP